MKRKENGNMVARENAAQRLQQQVQPTNPVMENPEDPAKTAPLAEEAATNGMAAEPDTENIVMGTEDIVICMDFNQMMTPNDLWEMFMATYDASRRDCLSALTYFRKGDICSEGGFFTHIAITGIQHGRRANQVFIISGRVANINYGRMEITAEKIYANRNSIISIPIIMPGTDIRFELDINTGKATVLDYDNRSLGRREYYYLDTEAAALGEFVGSSAGLPFACHD